jgi:hypothetical protein
MDDRTLLLQLERAQEVLDDKVEHLLGGELFDQLRNDLGIYVDISLEPMAARLADLEAKLDKVARNLLELTTIVVELVDHVEGKG